MPSIVVTSAPSACTASTVHDFTGSPVQMDGAGAAVGRVAADVRAGQPELVAQRVDQQQPRLDLELVLHAVDVQAHRNRCAHSSPSKVAGQVGPLAGP